MYKYTRWNNVVFFISLQQRKSFIELHTILLHNSVNLLSKFGSEKPSEICTYITQQNYLKEKKTDTQNRSPGILFPT